MPAFVTVLGRSAEIFEQVRPILLADARFIDGGDTVHCDGATAPLTNIYAVVNYPSQWEDWVPVDGVPNPQTMSTLLLECRSPEWVAAIGRMIAEGMDEPIWFVDAQDGVWAAGSVDAARIMLG